VLYNKNMFFNHTCFLLLLVVGTIRSNPNIDLDVLCVSLFCGFMVDVSGSIVLRTVFYMFFALQLITNILVPLLQAFLERY